MKSESKVMTMLKTIVYLILVLAIFSAFFFPVVEPLLFPANNLDKIP